MDLRKLEAKDAPLMLEWIHDPDVVKDLQANFAAKTLADCERFIAAAQDPAEDLHLAAVNEADEYLGTVSLKHINRTAGTAEFAITVRRCAMGTGASRQAMAEILRRGIRELELREIFWCVDRRNTRAVRFYDKNNYERVVSVPRQWTEPYDAGLLPELIWYRYTG